VFVCMTGPEITVYAFDSNTGETDWSTGIEGSNLTDTLAVTSDSVVTVTQRSSSCGESCLGSETIVTGLATTSGKRRWQRTVEHPANTGVTAASDGLYLVAGKTLLSIRSGDGQTNWSYRLGERGKQPPVVNNNAVYVGSSGGTLRVLE
jgi:outer membrane protein assembly factor BamB